MTTDEARKRIAKAQGWTSFSWAPLDGWCGCDPRLDVHCPLPNPLESDRDAALLRAWCVGRGWMVILACDEDGASATILETEPSGIGNGHVSPSIEPDPCRRERLALCRAVLQALEAIEAGGEA